MEIVILITSVLFIISTYINFNLFKKLEKYEEIIEENDLFIDDELKRNEALLEALRQIDQREMFEKDDEVGSIFYQIKETIERFKNK